LCHVAESTFKMSKKTDTPFLVIHVPTDSPPRVRYLLQVLGDYQVVLSDVG
jgi:hypothetical protein